MGVSATADGYGSKGDMMPFPARASNQKNLMFTSKNGDRSE